jgi:hypothetical protein
MSRTPAAASSQGVSKTCPMSRKKELAPCLLHAQLGPRRKAHSARPLPPRSQAKPVLDDALRWLRAPAKALPAHSRNAREKDQWQGGGLAWPHCLGSGCARGQPSRSLQPSHEPWRICASSQGLQWHPVRPISRSASALLGRQPARHAGCSAGACRQREVMGGGRAVGLACPDFHRPCSSCRAARCTRRAAHNATQVTGAQWPSAAHLRSGVGSRRAGLRALAACPLHSALRLDGARHTAGPALLCGPQGLARLHGHRDAAEAGLLRVARHASSAKARSSSSSMRGTSPKLAAATNTPAVREWR